MLAARGERNRVRGKDKKEDGEEERTRSPRYWRLAIIKNSKKETRGDTERAGTDEADAPRRERDE